MTALAWPIQPMLATLSAGLPPEDGRWAFELKWDGIRGLARVDQGRLTLLTRNAIDATARYPALSDVPTALNRRSAILDGEVIGYDASGRSTFEALQQGRAASYMVFDLLELDSRSLVGLPYTERRTLLEGLGFDGPHWHTPPYAVGGGEAMLRTSRELGMEGVVAKRLDSRYELGRRSSSWLKVKNQQRQEFVIGGWIPGEGRRTGTVGALVLGYYEGDRLISAGKVGTGFTNARLEELATLFQPLAQDTSPFAGGIVPRGTRFLEPSLVCEVEFMEWTARSGQLRHPSFKGLRYDKKAREVVREG